MKNKFIGIIPARYASTRFPGKPLALLGGKPVVQHVYERVEGILDDVIVATDDARILEAVKSFGGKAIMTKPTHLSGTDRVMEAYSLCGSTANVIINIQGDEPFISAEQISLLTESFDDPSTDISTLARRFDPNAGIKELEDPNLVKVTFDSQEKALYFSRSVIPYVRGVEKNEWLEKTDFYTHVGIYAYRADVLSKITQLSQTALEKAESLEQLRWLQAGFRINVKITHHSTIGIDTPDDLRNAQNYLEKL